MSRELHGGLALWHGVLASTLAGVGSDFSLPITGSAMEGPPGTDPACTEALFTVNLRWMIFSFLLLAALDHLVAAIAWKSYSAAIQQGGSPQRWAEYSVSATLMMVMISLLCGVTDHAAVLHVVVLYPMVMYCGHRTEQSPDHRGQWFLAGCALAVPAWIAVFVQVGLAASDIPDFVWAIIFSMLALFNSFAAVQFLQYFSHACPFACLHFDWPFAQVDRYYCYLSLAAKTLLAVLVFSNTMV